MKEQWTFKIEFKLSCESLDSRFCFNGGNKGTGWERKYLILLKIYA